MNIILGIIIGIILAETVLLLSPSNKRNINMAILMGSIAVLILFVLFYSSKAQSFELTQSKSLPIHVYQSNLKTLTQFEIEHAATKDQLNSCLDYAEQFTGDFRDILINRCNCTIMNHKESCNAI